jgi:hypothetical protein
LQPLVSQTLSIIPATEKYENQVNITKTESPVHPQESRDVKMILIRPINCWIHWTYTTAQEFEKPWA